MNGTIVVLQSKTGCLLICGVTQKNIIDINMCDQLVPFSPQIRKRVATVGTPDV